MVPKHRSHKKAHALHKRPPFTIKKATFNNLHDSFWLDRIDDVELAYHPFDLPMAGWWSNKWAPDNQSDEN